MHLRDSGKRIVPKRFLEENISSAKTKKVTESQIRENKNIKLTETVVRISGIHKNGNTNVNIKNRGKFKGNGKGVKILADIKNTLENKSYFDLHKYGPFALKSISKDFDLLPGIQSSVTDSKLVTKKLSSPSKDEVFAGCSTEPEHRIPGFYEMNDYVLVRYIFTKKVEYFVGKISSKQGNNYEVSFFKRYGKNDDTYFILPKQLDIDTIDEKMIVKKVELMTLNEKETQFVFYEDEDLEYFV